MSKLAMLADWSMDSSFALKSSAQRYFNGSAAKAANLCSSGCGTGDDGKAVLKASGCGTGDK